MWLRRTNSFWWCTCALYVFIVYGSHVTSCLFCIFIWFLTKLFSPNKSLQLTTSMSYQDKPEDHESPQLKAARKNREDMCSINFKHRSVFIQIPNTIYYVDFLYWPLLFLPARSLNLIDFILIPFHLEAHTQIWPGLIQDVRDKNLAIIRDLAEDLDMYNLPSDGKLKTAKSWSQCNIIITSRVYSGSFFRSWTFDPPKDEINPDLFEDAVKISTLSSTQLTFLYIPV